MNIKLLNAAIFLVSILLVSACVVHTGNPGISPASRAKMLEFKVYENIEYSRRGENILTGDLYVPEGEGNFPGVLLIHGGSWSGGARAHMKGIAKRLARQGFVAFNISYSLAPKHVYPAALEDSSAAINWMRENASLHNINHKKIGVWGYSAGGQLAARIGAQGTEVEDPLLLEPVQAVVAGSAPHDLTKYPESEAVITFLGLTIQEDPDVFREASPVFQINQNTPPMFLYHGSWDRIVHLSHTLDMKSALDKAMIENELYIVRGLGHIPLFVLGWGVERKAINFLSYYLK